jgi:hypothetical protein
VSDKYNFDHSREMNHSEVFTPLYEIQTVDEMVVYLQEYVAYVNARSRLRGKPPLTLLQHRDNIQLWLGHGTNGRMVRAWPIVKGAIEILRSESDG